MEKFFPVGAVIKQLRAQRIMSQEKPAKGTINEIPWPCVEKNVRYRTFQEYCDIILNRREDTAD